MKIQIVGGSLLNTNNYIVGDSNNVILIETSAMPRDIKAIVDGRNVKAIFLTHGHWDHSQHIDEAAKMFNAKIYAHEKAIKKIKSNEKQFNLDRPVNSQLEDNNFEFLKDNQTIDFGFVKVHVLFTPGHTDCSVSFLIEDGESKALFSGDTLFYQTCGRCDLPTSSVNDMKSSLKKLLALDENLDVYPGHGFKTTIKDERKTFEYLICDE